LFAGFVLALLGAQPAVASAQRCSDVETSSAPSSLPTLPHLSDDDIRFQLMVRRQTIRLRTFAALFVMGTVLAAGGILGGLASACYDCGDAEYDGSGGAAGAGIGMVGMGLSAGAAFALVGVAVRRRRTRRRHAALSVAPVGLRGRAGLALGAAW
jgi:hypothetical protein